MYGILFYNRHNKSTSWIINQRNGSMKTFIVYLFVYLRKKDFISFPPLVLIIYLYSWIWNSISPVSRLSISKICCCYQKEDFSITPQMQFSKAFNYKCFHSKKGHLWIHLERLRLDDFTWFIMLYWCNIVEFILHPMLGFLNILYEIELTLIATFACCTKVDFIINFTVFLLLLISTSFKLYREKL